MTRITLSVLAIALLVTVAPAQKAAFNSYGNPCPNTTPALQVQGLPKLGTSFTVSGVRFPGGCTRKYCPCTCCKCNTCFGGVLFVGIAKNNQLLPGGCRLLVTPDVLLLGTIQGKITLTVPNVNSLTGVRFYMQRLDLQLQEITGTQCPTTYQPMAFTGTSNGLEGIAGI
ncbi:MAG: hypothetical protein ACYST0_11335 [Planctomycetota bacterium]|jgi:hypothetical protein